MRNLLSDLEQAGKTEIINSIVSHFYRLSGPMDRDHLDAKRAKQFLNEFREKIGNDPIEAEIERQRRAKKRKQHRGTVARSRARSRQLAGLNARFTSLQSLDGVTAQQRGYRLEELFFDLLAFCEFEYQRPFRSSTSEQIDGHFRYQKFDYLVEVKWTSEPAKQADLSIFDGKIRGKCQWQPKMAHFWQAKTAHMAFWLARNGKFTLASYRKAQSTRGLFLSANGFAGSAIGKFSGDAPRIILMTGEDLALVLGGQVRFEDAMRDKVDAIVRKGQILLKLRSIAYFSR